MDHAFVAVQYALLLMPFLVVYIYFAEIKKLLYPANKVHGKLLEVKKGLVSTGDPHDKGYKNYTVKVGFVLNDEYYEIVKPEMFYKRVEAGDEVEVVVVLSDFSKSVVYKDYKQYRRNAIIGGALAMLIFIVCNYGLYLKLLKDAADRLAH